MKQEKEKNVSAGKEDTKLLLFAENMPRKINGI